jgi:nucleotide-binding universal stress UspA family protein
MLSIERILCPIDFSDTSRRAIGCAVALAGWYEAQLSVLHVFASVPVVDAVPAFGAVGLTPPLTLRDVDRDALLGQMRTIVGAGMREVPVELLVQEAPDVRAEILTEADVFDVDLIVMGSHGRTGVRRLLLGSVADAILRQAACPVLIVPPHADEHAITVPFKSIVCPVDFSPASRDAVRFALTLAQEDDAEITLVHSVEMPPELRDYSFPAEIDIDAVHAAARADALARLRDLVPASARDYCTVHTEATEGRPHRAVVLLAAERRADLIVMGAHGRSSLDRLVFGSNAYAVVRDAVCPVLAVHATAARE